MPETGMNFAQHLHPPRVQPQASPVCPESWGMGGCSQEALQYPDAVTQWAGSRQLQIDRQKEGQKSHFVSFLGSQSSWTPERKWHSWAALIAPQKKGFQQGILPCCDPLALQGSSAPSQLQNSVSRSYSLSREHAPLLLLSWLDPKQHKLSWLMPSVTPEIKLFRNRRHPSQPLERLKVFRELAENCSFSSSPKTNFKIHEKNLSKTGSILLRKLLFREWFLLIPASNVACLQEWQ